MDGHPQLQARAHRPMHMADWIAKLDAFLKLSGSDVLTHLGQISHEAAQSHAHTQFEYFDQQRRTLEAAQPTSDFDKVVKGLTAPQPPKPRKKRKVDDGKIA